MNMVRLFMSVYKQLKTMANTRCYSRIFAISDLHVDIKANFSFIDSWDDESYKNDSLIVAGDITDKMDLLRISLLTMRRKFKYVFYVPGNHELWIRNCPEKDSIAKFHTILNLCKELDIFTDPERIRVDPSSSVWIVPLFSWYTKPEEDPNDTLYEEASKTFKEDIKFSEQVWMDNHLCKWNSLPPGITASTYFSSLNNVRVNKHYDSPVITFSHFVPRLDLVKQHQSDITQVIEYRTLHNLGEPAQFQGGTRGFNFSRYAGSKNLERDLRTCHSALHVYGHQHRNRDRIIEHVRYVSHCLGYLKEQKEGWTWGINHWKGPKQIWPNEVL